MHEGCVFGAEEEGEASVKQLEFHPFSEIFPLLPDAELAELAEDIKSFGLREKIWLYQGKILDGRNRYLACQKAKKRPEYRTFKGSEAGALALVVSNNLRRRDLTIEQRGFAAARIANLRSGDNQYEVGPREPTSLSQAAERVGVSRNTAKRAKKVLEKGSKALQRAAEEGEVSLRRAAEVADLPKSEQLTAAKAKPPADDEGPDENEEARLSELQRKRTESLERAVEKGAQTEIDRLVAESKRYKESADRWQGECAAAIKQVKPLQRRVDQLERENTRLKTENTKLKVELSAVKRELAA